MRKKKGSFRYSLFFLIGAFGYSFLYWIVEGNFAHVFGIILVALVCYILYKAKLQNTGRERKNKDEGCYPDVRRSYFSILGACLPFWFFFIGLVFAKKFQAI